jgi:hypothetical protein
MWAGSSRSVRKGDRLHCQRVKRHGQVSQKWEVRGKERSGWTNCPRGRLEIWIIGAQGTPSPEPFHKYSGATNRLNRTCAGLGERWWWWPAFGRLKLGAMREGMCPWEWKGRGWVSQTFAFEVNIAQGTRNALNLGINRISVKGRSTQNYGFETVCYCYCYRHHS